MPENLSSCNVIIAIPCLNTGGTEMQTLQLTKVLIAEKYSVRVLCYFEWDDKIVDAFVSLGCEVDLLKFRRTISTLKFINYLRIYFKNHRPHLVHVQYLAPGLLPIIASRLAGINTILATVHQPYTKLYHGLTAKIFLRISAILCTKFITVSENAERTWFQTSLVYNPFVNKNKRKHFTIHNAIDIKNVDSITNHHIISSLKKEVEFREPVIIGAVSRLRFEKGIDTLIQAFKILLNDTKNIRLLIVGSGPDEGKLKSLTQALGISEFVVFCGNTEWAEAIKIMHTMDIVVCPSRFEGFGLAAAEAMALNKPVIATNVGGLSEVVEEDISGFLIPPEDSERMAIKLLELINYQEKRVFMGKNGRQRVETLFSLESFHFKIQSLYKSLMTNQ